MKLEDFNRLRFRNDLNTLRDKLERVKSSSDQFIINII